MAVHSIHPGHPFIPDHPKPRRLRRDIQKAAGAPAVPKS